MPGGVTGKAREGGKPVRVYLCRSSNRIHDLYGLDRPTAHVDAYYPRGNMTQGAASLQVGRERSARKVIEIRDQHGS